MSVNFLEMELIEGKLYKDSNGRVWRYDSDGRWFEEGHKRLLSLQVDLKHIEPISIIRLTDPSHSWRNLEPPLTRRVEAQPARPNQACQALHFRQVPLRCPTIPPPHPDQDTDHAIFCLWLEHKPVITTHKQKRHPVTDGVLQFGR